MSGAISGAVGGVLAVVILTYIARSAGKPVAAGQLRYGIWMWLLALACLAFAIVPVVLVTIKGDDKQFAATIALLVGFGIAAIWAFGEVLFVRGTFDETGIAFSTPWTGKKSEKWKDLVNFEFNAACSWYTLTFASGSRIRLSQYLNGHREALRALQDEASRRSIAP